jgi:hypothetical protein
MIERRVKDKIWLYFSELNNCLALFKSMLSSSRSFNVMIVLRLSMVITISSFHKVKHRPLNWLLSHAVWEYKTEPELNQSEQFFRLFITKIYLWNGNEKSLFIVRNWSWDMCEKNTGLWQFAWLSKSLCSKRGFTRKRNRWQRLN